ncbi:matrilysin-like [Clytia hemisphaerica]|uniref:matrilysin-like n=1 Tax=Clytia hemisphaerica TaxID=252671 RepID=UPI0034D3B1B1
MGAGYATHASLTPIWDISQFNAIVKKETILTCVSTNARNVILFPYLIKKKIKRCGMATPSKIDNQDVAKNRKRRFIPQGTAWNKKLLTWRIDENTNDLPNFLTRLIIRKAFNIWSKWIPMTFQEKNKGKVDISIKFVKKIHRPCQVAFTGQDGIVAHAYYPYQGQDIAGDIHFNDDQRFTHNAEPSDRGGMGTNLAWSALHEIGHSLGLEHSNIYGAVMSPFYTSFYHPGVDLALTNDDIKGVQAIYGKSTHSKTNRVDSFLVK